MLKEKKRSSSQVETFSSSEKQACKKGQKPLLESKASGLKQLILRIQTAWQTAITWETVDPPKANPFYEAARHNYLELIGLKKTVSEEDYFIVWWRQLDNGHIYTR